MAQHEARHLYVTAVLEGTGSSPWPMETSAFGWRLNVRDNDTPFSLDAGRVENPSFLVNDASVSRTTTHFAVQQSWAGDSGVGGINVTDADQDALCEAVWTYLNSVKGNLMSTHTLESVRLYAIAPDGKSATAPNLYVPSAALTGGGSGPTPVLALVNSTQSATRGRHGRGRWFLGPMTSGTAGNDGIITSGTRTAFAGYAKTLLDAFRAAGGITRPSYTPIVWERGTVYGNVIRSVRIGDELDFQQRRRRQRPETYTSVVLA